MTTLFTRRSQAASAWFCLVAVILLFAPLAGAAWSAHAAACCTSDRCPIPEHHHSQKPQHSSDCENHNGGMDACSMRCCQSTDRPAATTLNFVVPDAASLVEPDHVTAGSQIWQADHFLRSIEVFSPPPRQFAVSL